MLLIWMTLNLLMMSNLTFLSLNIGMSSTLGGLKSLISTFNIDVALLQEVCQTTEVLCNLLHDIGFQAASNVDPDNLNRPGTAIVWRDGVSMSSVEVLIECRCQVATIGSLNILNLYAPSGSNKRQERAIFFGQSLFHFIMQIKGQPLVAAGDFNSVLKPSDIENGVGFSKKKFVRRSMI